jgi:type I restriction enzyme M protein
VLLIDASKCYEARRKPIGNKRVDITEPCRNLIIKAYGDYCDKDYEETISEGKTVRCKSRRLDSISLGYNKIVVESPLMDENGNQVIKKGTPVPDTSKRDTESIPLDEDMDAYFAREVLPFNPDAWIDRSKSKVGYEIPFTRTFYEYKQIEPADTIAKRIEIHEQSLMKKLHGLFGEAGE